MIILTFLSTKKEERENKLRQGHDFKRQSTLEDYEKNKTQNKGRARI